MITQLGGNLIAGQNMRKTAWSEKESNPTNPSGFSAIPSGWCSGLGDKWEFIGIGYKASWWSNDPVSNTYKDYYSLIFTEVEENFTMNKGEGLSVRCIRNEPYLKP